MNKRDEKARIVEVLREVAISSDIVIVSKNKGITVGDINNLRRSMRAANGSYVVAKNTLAKIAFKGTKYELLNDMLTGPVSLSYSSDPVSAAKALSTFCKGNEKLEICGAIMDNRLLSISEVEMLASLPSLDELRARIIGLLNAPATKLVRVINEPAAKTARVVQAYAAKQ